MAKEVSSFGQTQNILTLPSRRPKNFGPTSPTSHITETMVELPINTTLLSYVCVPIYDSTPLFISECNTLSAATPVQEISQKESYL